MVRFERARTLRQWEAVRSRRRPTDPWNAHQRPALREPRPAAHPTRREVVLGGRPQAPVPRRAGRHNPQAGRSRGEGRNQEARRAPGSAGRRTGRPEPGRDRRSRRTDSDLPACPLGTAAVQEKKAAAERPKAQAPAAAEAGRTAAAGRPIAGEGAVGEPAVAAAARNEAAAVAHPIAAAGVALAQGPRGPARSGREDPAGSVQAPPRQVQRPPRAHRTTSRTCWWADSWRHTACRRS